LGYRIFGKNCEILRPPIPIEQDEVGIFIVSRTTFLPQLMSPPDKMQVLKGASLK